MSHDPLYERHVTRAGYVEYRLRPVPALVTALLLSCICWALIYAGVSLW